MDVYRIVYIFPELDPVVQHKTLIPHELYLQEKDKKKPNLPEFYFTNQSPMYEAITTGVLHHYGGQTKVIITKSDDQ